MGMVGAIRPFVAGVFVCAVTGPVAADTIKYTDKAEFLAAATGELNTITFEGAPTGSQTYVGNQYTIDGVTFISNHMYLADGDLYSGWFSLGTGDTLLAGYEYAPGTQTLTAVLNPGTRAVGLDIGLEKGGAYTITFATGQVLTGTLGQQVYDGDSYLRNPDFVGFVSDTDIASILFESNGGGWKVVDNFTTANVVPVPPAVWGGLGLVGLGIVQQLRRRREAAVDVG
jgi:hypothetical protein